ncbi:hypothetical protein ISS37_07590 [candidate division KSB1 bacterium]|nr:hypothetical protein [candidate division KSB1 bacterium]
MKIGLKIFALIFLSVTLTSGQELTVRQTTVLLENPGGRKVGLVLKGAKCKTKASPEGDWVKVQLEGWVQRSAQEGADARYLKVTEDQLETAAINYLGRNIKIERILLKTLEKRGHRLRMKLSDCGFGYLHESRINEVRDIPRPSSVTVWGELTEVTAYGFFYLDIDRIEGTSW